MKGYEKIKIKNRLDSDSGTTGAGFFLVSRFLFHGPPLISLFSMFVHLFIFSSLIQTDMTGFEWTPMARLHS